MFGSSPGIRIARLFGIGVHIQPSWVLIFLLVTSSLANRFSQESSLELTTSQLWIMALFTSVAFFLSILAHEFGHALTARYYKIGTESISLHLFGGVARISREPGRPGEEFWIAIAGPVVSVLIAISAGAVYWLTKGHASLDRISHMAALVASVNTMLFVFNMLPGFPMDGGRVLRALVWKLSGNLRTATRVASFGGMGMAGLMILGGVLLLIAGDFGGLWFMLIGYFLFQLAKASLAQADLRALFDSAVVRDLMRPVDAVIPASMSVGEAVERFFTPLTHEVFPVVSGPVLVGFVTRDSISKVERRQWDWTRIEELAADIDPQLHLAPDQDAMEGYFRLASVNRGLLPVFAEKKLVGFLLRKDVAHFLDLRQRQLGVRAPFKA